MALKIKEIILENGDLGNYRNTNETPIQKLTEVSKINIFIGENNSGKSRFLRELFKTNFNYIPDGNREVLEYLQEFRKFISAYIGPGRSMTIKFDSPIGNRHEVTPNEVLLIIDEILNKAQPLNINAAETKEPIYITSLKIIEQVSRAMGYSKIKDLLDIPLVQYSIKEKQNFKFSALYIPVLRGLRPIQLEAERKKRFIQTNVYLERTNKDYFNFNTTVELNRIFTGLDLYEQLQKKILGTYEDQLAVKDFSKFLSTNFFDNRYITLTPQKEKDVVYVKIGDEKEKAIYDLGDGIQQIIILTFQMFMNKGKNMLFFIEEPELCLHPGMQRIFIDTISRHEGFENFQYFIATHSNHFLDITLDANNISVYTFRKTQKIDENGHPFFNIENANNDDISILELIGVRNSSIFLSNCTVWVEGITDRMYLRKYLELYQNYESEKAKKENKPFRVFKEDLHYSFIEYSGGNITHWSFTDDSSSFEKIKASRINNKILLIADNDNAVTGTKKAERHTQLKEILKDNFYLLQCREIENLLAPEVLKSMINNPTLAINYDDYKNQKIGEFLDNKVGNSSKYSNILKDRKVKFAQEAITYVNVYNDLSEEAQILTKKIYDFIASHNNA